MLLEKIGYVVETVSIYGRTTPVVHAVVNCYAPTIIQTYNTISLVYLTRIYRNLDDSILAVLKDIVCLFYS